MRINQPTYTPPPRTHEGAIAARITPFQELRRSVMACLLWENTFYESGESIADRIAKLVAANMPMDVSTLAIEARSAMKLRHVPLLLARELARNKQNIADLLPAIIQRADELTEFLAIYWKNGKQPISASAKRGLAKAFKKFSEYDLAKYNRDNAIKLRDVLFLTHPKPDSQEQAALWKRLVDDKLAIPDTWETKISACKTPEEKLTQWTRLVSERKLGALAFLRNLRNMQQIGVSEAVIRSGLNALNTERVLPFRFISAAKYAPSLEDSLEQLMFKCVAEMPKLSGKTALLVDGSGSMFGGWGRLSAKSELERFEAASALAILIREICENTEIFVFSNNCRLVPPRRGFALRDVMKQAAEQGGTETGKAILSVNQYCQYDRIIVLTDEQSHDEIVSPLPKSKAYFVNVASYQNGIGYGRWTHIDGWSESIISYIQTIEKE